MSDFECGVARVAYVLICCFLYLLPSAIACNKKHSNAVLIIFFNVCLSWTFVCWILAAFWALEDDEAPF